MTNQMVSWYYPVTLRLTVYMLTWPPKHKYILVCPRTRPVFVSLSYREGKQVQLGREQDSSEGPSPADVRRTTPASVCSVCSGKREWIHPAASLRATDGRYTLPHCRPGPICNGMYCLIFRPLTVLLGTTGCFSISKSNNTSTLENKHTLY